MNRFVLFVTLSFSVLLTGLTLSVSTSSHAPTQILFRPVKPMVLDDLLDVSGLTHFPGRPPVAGLCSLAVGAGGLGVDLFWNPKRHDPNDMNRLPQAIWF